MEGNWLWFDGQWQNENELSLSENRSFLFGDGFFETIRVKKNKEVLLRNFHWARLQKTIAALQFPWPADLHQETFWSLIFSKMPFEPESDIRLKIVFFRKGSGRYAPDKVSLAFTVSLSPIEYPWIQFGQKLGKCESVTLSANPFSWVKSTSALPYVMAGMECRNRNFDDLVLCQNDGFVVEGTYSSLFWLSENKIQIPNPELGGLHSCMKEFLMKFWKEKGVVVEFKAMHFNDLMNADWVGMANGTGLKIFDLKNSFDQNWVPDFARF
jgi:branched-subunit amino acid aminotransferase/4-amino-4-deoxychorismate lyase